MKQQWKTRSHLKQTRMSLDHLPVTRRLSPCTTSQVNFAANSFCAGVMTSTLEKEIPSCLGRTFTSKDTETAGRDISVEQWKAP